MVSNLASATGLQKAEAYGITTVITEVDASIPNPRERREEHERRLLTILNQHNIEAVILSGYMRIPSFRYSLERSFDEHPPLLAAELSGGPCP